MTFDTPILDAANKKSTFCKQITGSGKLPKASNGIIIRTYPIAKYNCYGKKEK